MTGVGGWVFLFIVLTIYGVAGVIDIDIVGESLSLSGQVMAFLLPVLAMVFLLLLTVDLVFSPDRVKRHLGAEAGIKGWLVAAIGGVLATGPTYAWYALLRELREKGMRASLVSVFLYCRAVKLPLLPLMIHYFGTAFTLVLCVCLVGFSFVTGMLMQALESRDVV